MAPDTSARPLSVPVAAGVRLHVRHRPGGTGRPFLLVHGVASNARCWDEVAGRLAAAGHPVYAVDLRGHGRSDAPADGYDTATAAADLAAAAAALGLTGAVVTGHSWGGNVAVRLAAGRPDLVAALGLVDGGWIDLPAAVPSWDDCRTVAGLLRGPVHGTTAPAMRDYLRATHPGWSEISIEGMLGDLRVEPDGSLTPLPSPAQFLAIMRSLWDDPPGPDLALVDVPVLLLPAVPDGNPTWAALVRRWVAAAAAALTAPTTTRWYAGGDHHLHADQPERVAADLLELAAAGRPTRESTCR